MAAHAVAGITWEPRDPAFEQTIRDVFAQQGPLTEIGATLGRVEPGLVEVVLPCSPRVSQQHGTVHGGLIGLLADTAGALSALTVAKAGTIGMTVEYKVNLLAPARGERVVARGRLIRPGRPLSVAAADIYAVSDEGEESLVATSLVTLAASRGSG